MPKPEWTVFDQKTSVKFIDGQKINIPDIGGMQEFNAFYRAIFDCLTKNKENWKKPIEPVKLTSLDSALRVIEALIFFVGGAEMKETDDIYLVKSRGYYHYIGA